MNPQESEKLIQLFNAQTQEGVDNAFILLLTFLRCPFKAIKFYIDNTTPVIENTGRNVSSLEPRKVIHIGRWIVPLFNEPSEIYQHAIKKTKLTDSEMINLKNRVLEDYNFYSLAQVDAILKAL